MADLLEGADCTKAAGAFEVLMERLMAAVVTRDDDRQLSTRAQSVRPWSDYAADPWLRYRSAGFPLEDFAPFWQRVTVKARQSHVARIAIAGADGRGRLVLVSEEKIALVRRRPLP